MSAQNREVRGDAEGLWHNAKLLPWGDPDHAIPDAAMVMREGRIAWIGARDALPEMDVAGLPRHDVKGRWITPGLVDCHTHLVFAGQRADEFALRLLNMACTLFRLSVAEALAGVTCHAARALGQADRHGMLEAGRHADFVVWDIESPAELAYWFGRNPCERVVQRGRIVHQAVR